MKRKLNEEDIPTPAKSTIGKQESAHAFGLLGLDSRLLQAVAKEGFVTPTAVQAKTIPLALEGKDILARANTGSGKTAAYVLPILEAILRRKAANPTLKATTALILVPTRELADQVSKVCIRLSTFCANDIRTVNLTQRISDVVQRSLLADIPDIVVATPARASFNLSTSALSFESLAHLIIDEADLVLSYDYEEDLQNIAKARATGVQTVLMSATLNTEVDTIKELFCRDPVILTLGEVTGNDAGISQYIVKCAEKEKFLLVYVIFKLKLIKGKSIIFVGDIDRCYRLKLFLEQFGTKSCILNSELPVNSRIHVVEEFNKNVYDIIIATDEKEVLGADHGKKSKKQDKTPKLESAKVKKDLTEDVVEVNGDSERISDHETLYEQTEKPPQLDEPKKKKRKVVKKDKEYGISRGIDFQNVACVLNFDLPTSSKSYIHRIGRTARAGKTGMALSFIIPTSLYRKHKSTSLPSTQHDETVLAEITADQAARGKELTPYDFDMAQVNAFRYRMTDALRAITRLAIRSARTRELRQELLQSEKLKRHFEENPDDLRHLRHDGEMRAARIQPHLKHVPEYLMPRAQAGQKALAGKGQEIGFVGMGRTSENWRRKASEERKRRGRIGGKKVKVGVRGKDPLKNFNAKERR